MIVSPENVGYAGGVNGLVMPDAPTDDQFANHDRYQRSEDHSDEVMTPDRFRERAEEVAAEIFSINIKHIREAPTHCSESEVNGGCSDGTVCEIVEGTKAIARLAAEAFDEGLEAAVELADCEANSAVYGEAYRIRKLYAAIRASKEMT